MRGKYFIYIDIQTKEIPHQNQNKGLRIPQLAKIQTWFPAWWGLLN